MYTKCPYLGDQDGEIWFLAIFSFTTLMDKRSWALWPELISAFAGLFIIYFQEDWFGMNAVWPMGKYVVAGWFLCSVLVSTYFVFTEVKESRLSQGLQAK